MKIKSFILKLIFALILFSQNSFAKNLPPGSGISDVPANVLILLDKSGSMSIRMTSGTGFLYPTSVAVDANGDVYAAQYRSYGVKKLTYATGAVDSTFGSSGTYSGSGNCRVYYAYGMQIHNGYLYVASYYSHRVFRINLTTGVCDWNHYVPYPRHLSIKNNIMNVFSSYTRHGLTRNLTTNRDISCNYFYHYTLTSTTGGNLDASGNNFYVHYSRNLYRFTRDSNGCVNVGSPSRSIYNSECYRCLGITAHPTDDSILYATNYNIHKLYKITLNAAKTSASYSSVGGYCTGTSTAARVCMGSPAHVALDSNNNRVFVANYHKSSVQAFDLNLGFLKEFGGVLGTRMSGAHEAIKAIVTDSSLTASVDFGFGYWSSSGRGFSDWRGNITTGTAIPCNYNGCLKVRVHKQGASRINQIISSVQPGGGTYASDWAKMAQDYYLHSKYSPIDKNLTCQNSYVLVIGDGDWQYHSSAKTKTKQLLNKHKIKTFTVAYGGGLSATGINNFRDMAIAGGTKDVIIADTTESLKTQLKAAISQIIASKLSFTAPAITATIEKGGSLYQAQFDYVQNEEWNGTLTRTAMSKEGVLDENDKGNWSADDMMGSPSSRKIWSAIPGTSYSNYNNFTTTNWNEINAMFQLTGNQVNGYHSVTDNPQNSRRCSSTSGVANGTDDDVKGLINFLRGEDYFDYDGDCKLNEKRPKVLGDIYHSELVVVGAPSAEVAFRNSNQESYWRSKNNYTSWANSKANRQEIIYVGANDGMLHAFDTKTGKEKWAFVPPFILPKLPNIVNVNLNRSGKGGSNAIYGVDGSPTVHDMYFQSAYDTSKQWHTILMIPYGRGGAGFSVLDVTDPDAPLHLYSVLNDTTRNKVHIMDHNNFISDYDYIATSYPLSEFTEAVLVADNYNNSVGSMTCDASGNNQCYKSRTWTFPVDNVQKSDLTVLINDVATTNYSLSKDSNGRTLITFNQDVTYYGGDPGDDTKASTLLAIKIKQGSTLTGVKTQPEYDYSGLGETWSAPRILRLPNDGAGDTNIDDNIYVAVMGGGFGAYAEDVGSNLFVINLEDTTHPGKVEKVVPIEDKLGNDITNSIPSTPVVITADSSLGISYAGALVYLNDLEGKVSKVNLTNMDTKGDGNALNLYDKTILLDAQATPSNGRYMFHAMDSGIGTTSKNLWLFTGTGDYERIGSTSSSMENLMLGFRDTSFPLFNDVKSAANSRRFDKFNYCTDTTGDNTGAKCALTSSASPPKDQGWYIKLPRSQKVTAEPTLTGGVVYFPIYEPSTSVNKCSIGQAFICGVDDECGANYSGQMGPHVKDKECHYVGDGVLSKIVTFGDQLFANIAGQSTGTKKDLVQKKSIANTEGIIRTNWREGNF